MSTQLFPHPESRLITGASILLADDSPIIQGIVKMLLERAGAKVVIAGNGKEVLDLVHLEYFDCVLMDIQMPEMDGLEATRLLRADPSLAGLRIIGISANSLQAEGGDCLAAGMDDFLAKPFSAGQLFTMLAKWLPQYSLDEAASATADDVPLETSRQKISRTA